MWAFSLSRCVLGEHGADDDPGPSFVTLPASTALGGAVLSGTYRIRFWLMKLAGACDAGTENVAVAVWAVYEHRRPLWLRRPSPPVPAPCTGLFV